MDIKEDEEEERANRGSRFAILMFPFLVECFNRFFCWKVRKYLAGICPRKRMSCIGKYRRNLIDFEQTSRYSTCWVMFSWMEFVLLMLLTHYKNEMSSQTIFWAWNIPLFVFIDIINGIVLPLTVAVPAKEKQKPDRRVEFYTRKPRVLEPRRPSDMECSRKSRKQIRKRKQNPIKKKRGGTSIVQVDCSSTGQPPRMLTDGYKKTTTQLTVQKPKQDKKILTNFKSGLPPIEEVETNFFD